VQSVRPCIRIGADGFTLRETVAEYVQVAKIRAADLADLGLQKPEGCPTIWSSTSTAAARWSSTSTAG